MLFGFGVTVGNGSLHKSPPHQLDERLRNLTAIVVTPIELCGNPHEVTFGAVQAREIIQRPQHFIQFAHVPAKQLIHVQESVVDGHALGQVGDGRFAQSFGQFGGLFEREERFYAAIATAH